MQKHEIKASFLASTKNARLVIPYCFGVVQVHGYYWRYHDTCFHDLGSSKSTRIKRMRCSQNKISKGYESTKKLHNRNILNIFKD